MNFNDMDESLDADDWTHYTMQTDAQLEDPNRAESRPNYSDDEELPTRWRSHSDESYSRQQESSDSERNQYLNGCDPHTPVSSRDSQASSSNSQRSSSNQSNPFSSRRGSTTTNSSNHSSLPRSLPGSRSISSTSTIDVTPLTADNPFQGFRTLTLEEEQDYETNVLQYRGGTDWNVWYKCADDAQLWSIIQTVERVLQQAEERRRIFYLHTKYSTPLLSNASTSVPRHNNEYGKLNKVYDFQFPEVIQDDEGEAPPQPTWGKYDQNKKKRRRKHSQKDSSHSSQSSSEEEQTDLCMSRINVRYSIELKKIAIFEHIFTVDLDEDNYFHNYYEDYHFDGNLSDYFPFSEPGIMPDKFEHYFREWLEFPRSPVYHQTRTQQLTRLVRYNSFIDKFQALSMAFHPRLGQDAEVNQLDRDNFQQIFEIAYRSDGQLPRDRRYFRY
jgi:hypothetical protein